MSLTLYRFFMKKVLTKIYIQLKSILLNLHFSVNQGWSGGALCRVNFQCRCVLLIWIRVGQGPTVLIVGVDGGVFGHFYSPLSFLSSFSLSLGDGPIETEILSQRAVKPKTTNQPTV